MIPGPIAEKILLVGPDHHDHRGGIGAVIDTYKDLYEVFNFIPTFRPYNTSWRKSLFFAGQFIRIGMVLASNRKIRIVHIHSSKRGSLYRKLLIACLAKLVFGKKTINHIHTGGLQHFYESSHPIARKIIGLFLRMNDVTITVSESLKTYCETTFPLQRVYRIGNIVSDGPVNTSGIPTIGNGRINLLYLGLIDQKKGVFDLLEVLARYKAVLTGRIRLVVGGNGRIDQLKNMIESYQLEDLVEYRGWVTGPDKQHLLQYTDLFVLPSYYEGIPMAILEAMRYGKPIIATKVGGIPELVQQGINGYLIDPGDQQALLQAVLYYVNNPRQIALQGAGSAMLVDQYSAARIIPQLTSIYQSLL